MKDQPNRPTNGQVSYTSNKTARSLMFLAQFVYFFYLSTVDFRFLFYLNCFQAEKCIDVRILDSIIFCAW